MRNKTGSLCLFKDYRCNVISKRIDDIFLDGTLLSSAGVARFFYHALQRHGSQLNEIIIQQLSDFQVW